MNLNKFFGVGRLTADPEFRSTPQGTSMAKFNIAINDRVKVNGEYVEKVFFIGGTIWGNSAEAFIQFHKKGDQVFVEGKLDKEEWDKDGVHYHRTVLRDVRWEFADNKRADTSPAASGATIPSANQWSQPATPAQAPQPNPVQAAAKQTGQTAMPVDYDPFADDDFIPDGTSPI